MPADQPTRTPSTIATPTAPDVLRVGFFSRSVVSRVARERGMFASLGLEVVEVPVASSIAQFRSLQAGEYDLVLTSPDNVAAYRLTESNGLRARLDVRMLLGLDAGLGLSVIGAPGVRSLEDLRGRIIGVDVPSSGFANALFRVLAQAGLQRDRDYALVALGSTPNRRAALLRGQCDATLLNAGHDIAAELDGCHRLVRITESLRPYLGTVLATTGPWLDEHLDLARRFAQAWLAATSIVVDPAEKAFVEALLEAEYTLPSESTGIAYEMLTSRRDGLIPDGHIDRAALHTVLETRARYGGPDTGVNLAADFVEASGLIDDRLLRSQP